MALQCDCDVSLLIGPKFRALVLLDNVNSEISAIILVKRHFCHVKNLRLGHDLPTSVNASDLAVSRGFYFQEKIRNYSTLAWTCKGGLCAYAINTKIVSAGPSL